MPPASPPLPLDLYGLLPPERFDAASAGAAYLVFAQQAHSRIDVEAWRGHASRFFASDLVLSVPKRYGPLVPSRDGAHVVLTPRDRLPVMRSVFLRPRTDLDVHAAEAANAGGGLLLLAKRCPTVALVLVDETARPTDLGALRIAAFLSSVLLGPALTPDGLSLKGARSLREQLEQQPRA